MTALHRALAALLGLPDAAALPLDYAVHAEHAPQAALERAWDGAREPAFLRMALYELREVVDTTEADERAQDAWDEALFSTDAAERYGTIERLLPFLAGAVRAAVPCPVLPCEART